MAWHKKHEPDYLTRQQLVAVILLDCINKCNSMMLTKENYDRHLKAMLKERLGTTGQKEMSI